jgi:hypothetical protein
LYGFYALIIFLPQRNRREKRENSDTYFNNKVATLIPQGAGTQQRSYQKKGEKFSIPHSKT